MTLDALQHLIGAHPLPRVEHLVEQRVPVGEMPVEAALGHAERLRQGLDPDGVRAAGRKGLQAFLDPPATGRPGDGGHGLSLSVRELTVLLVMLHFIYTVPYRWRFPHAAPRYRAHLPALAHPRAHGRLPARGRVGPADAGRPG